MLPFAGGIRTAPPGSDWVPAKFLVTTPGYSMANTHVLPRGRILTSPGVMGREFGDEEIYAGARNLEAGHTYDVRIYPNSRLRAYLLPEEPRGAQNESRAVAFSLIGVAVLLLLPWPRRRLAGAQTSR